MGKGKVREFEIKKWLVIQTKYEQVFENLVLYA